MGLLKGGNLVVSSGESIQLLGSKRAVLSEASQDPEITRIYQLDKAICGSSKENENTSLLDMETLAVYRIGHLGIPFTSRFLCASFNEEIILCLWKHDGLALLRLYVTSGAYPM